MNKILFLLCLVSFGSLGIVAQDIPPPSPLIYSPPLESEIKEFTSQESKFKISFPGNPSVEPNDKAEIKSITYKVRRKGSNSSVDLMTFKEDVEAQRDEFIKGYKEVILSTNFVREDASFPKIYYEKEVEIGGYKAFEIAYSLTGRVYEVGRLVFAKDKLYIISTDVTNWHILNDYYKNKVADFQKETERFFNSFMIIEK